MKKILIAVISAALILALCSCDPGVIGPSTTSEPDSTQKYETIPVTSPETAAETVTQDATTEAETEAPVTETGEYTVINTALIASAGSSGTLYLYSDNTYKAKLVTASSELGVESITENTEYGSYETSDGVNLICAASEICVKITFKTEADKSAALEALGILQDMDIISGDYIDSYKKACGGEGYAASIGEARSDAFLSSLVSDADTSVFLDKEKELAYDVTVKYDLPDGSYRVAEENCVLKLDPDGKKGECTIDFPLSGDDGDGLGHYTESTVLIGSYVRSENTVTCTIKGEKTVLRYDSAESQQAYLQSLEEAFENGKIVEEVYNYNKAAASEEGRYLDYGDETDEYILYVIDMTHAAVFTSTPSMEYPE